MIEKSRAVDELIDLHMDFLSEVRVTSFPSSERVMFPAPSKILTLGCMYVVICGIILFMPFLVSGFSGCMWTEG